MQSFSAETLVPPNIKENLFYELDGVVCAEAANYTRAINTGTIHWKTIPDLGRTGSSITSIPVTAPQQKPGGNAAHLQYEFYTYDSGAFKINAYFSPSLNFYNTEEGLQYAISIDNEEPQIISINKEDKNTGSGGIWNKWVAENIIIKTSQHTIAKPGKHILKYWMVNSGVILQKSVADFGGAGTRYLGPKETRKLNQ
jgi:hypothetical protein